MRKLFLSPLMALLMAILMPLLAPSALAASPVTFSNFMDYLAKFSNFEDEDQVKDQLLSLYNSKNAYYIEHYYRLGVSPPPYLPTIFQATAFSETEQKRMIVFATALLTESSSSIGYFRKEAHEDRKLIPKLWIELMAYLDAYFEPNFGVKTHLIDLSPTTPMIDLSGIAGKKMRELERLSDFQKMLEPKTKQEKITDLDRFSKLLDQETEILKTLGYKTYLESYHRHYFGLPDVKLDKDFINLLVVLSSLQKTLTKDPGTVRAALLKLNAAQIDRLYQLIMNYGSYNLREALQKHLLNQVTSAALESILSDDEVREAFLYSAFRTPSIPKEVSIYLPHFYLSPPWEYRFAKLIAQPVLERMPEPGPGASLLNHFFYLVSAHSQLDLKDLKARFIALYNNHLPELHSFRKKRPLSVKKIDQFNDFFDFDESESELLCFFFTTLIARDPHPQDRIFNLALPYRKFLPLLEEFYLKQFGKSVDIEQYYLRSIANTYSDEKFRYLDQLSLKTGITRLEALLVKELSFDQTYWIEKKKGVLPLQALINAYRSQLFSLENIKEFLGQLALLKVEIRDGFYTELKAEPSISLFLQWHYSRTYPLKTGTEVRMLAQKMLSEITEYPGLIDSTFTQSNWIAYIEATRDYSFFRGLHQGSDTGCDSELRKR